VVALGDFTARQGPILLSSVVAAMLGVVLSIAFGRVCWEIFGLALVVLAFGAVVGRRPS
jgi:hypothetical protein